MRYLGIDFGIKRMGLALGSPAGGMAFPLKTIIRTTRQAMFNELLEIIREHDIQAVVLGIPMGLDGQETLTGRQAVNFMESLKRRVNIPVFTVNEAYTSVEAEAILNERGMDKNSIRQNLDQVAAVLILESYFGCK